MIENESQHEGPQGKKKFSLPMTDKPWLKRSATPEEAADLIKLYLKTVSSPRSGVTGYAVLSKGLRRI